MEEYLKKTYPNYTFLKQMAVNADINEKNISNILNNKYNAIWFEGAQRWYNLNFPTVKGLTLTPEQCFNTIFMCLISLKNGKDITSKQIIDKDGIKYNPPRTAAYYLTQMLIIPNYIVKKYKRKLF